MQFIYLILSLYFGKKNPLFYLIFPIALVSGPGAFIDSRTVLFGVDIFTQSKNIYKDVVIFYLLLVVLYLYGRCKFSILRKSPMRFYTMYIVLLIVYTFASAGTSYDALNMIRLFTNMILGYYLIALVFTAATYRQFVSFVNFLLIITAILSIFYVLNSSKTLPVFNQKDMYQEVDEGAAGFYRDFSTIPYFSQLLFLFSFSALLLKNRTFNRKALMSVLITYPFVLLYTFTRGLLLGVVIQIIVIILYVIWKKPHIVFRTSTVAIALGLVFIFGVIKMVFVNELNYYNQRVTDAKTEGANEQNVAIRIAYHVLAYDIISSNNALIIGDGINKRHDQKMNTLGAWQADSTIPFLVILTGVVGVLIYYYLGLYFIRTTFVNILREQDPFFLALFTYITFALFASLFFGGYRWGDPFIFYPYALVIGLNSIITKTKLQKNKVVILQ